MKKLSILFLILCFTFCYEFSYAQNKTYYVSSSTGRDSNTGLSASEPWRSIVKVNETIFQPGDKILFKRGDRWYRGLVPRSSGTSSSLITFSAYGTGNLPIISPTSGPYAINIRIKSHIKVENIHAIAPSSGSGIAVRGNSYGNIITNCKAIGHSDGNSRSGIVYAGIIDGNSPSGTKVVNNEVSGFFQCIYGHGGLKSTGIIEGNKVSNARDDGIVARYGDFKNLKIRNNDITSFRDDGIDLFGGNNVVVEYNKISKLPVGSIVAGNGIKAGGGNVRSENIIVRYNVVHNLRHSSNSLKAGITANGGDKMEIYGNLVYDVDGEAIVVPTGSENIYIYNNTAISNNKQALFVGSYNGIVLRNNIFWGNRSDLNINGRVSSSNNILINGLDESNYSSVNDVNGSPNDIFADYQARNFKLKRSSPAIDRGTSISGFTKGLAGVSVVGSIDIGAYQFGEVQSNSAPTVSLGNDKTFTLPLEQIILEANVQDDGVITWHNWTKVSGPSVSLNEEGYNKLVLSNFSTGIYRFKLAVRDDQGEESSDEVVVTINEESNSNPDSPGDLISGLRYSYYEGTWSTLPDFSRISSLKEGTLTDFSIAPRNRDENFGFVFEGFIKIDAAGSYTFYTTSDDGSKLYINGSEVVNNDGLHSARERSGSTNLTSGYHSIRVEFFERSGQEVLQVRYSGPGVGKQIIPGSNLFLEQGEDQPPTQPDDPNPDNPGDLVSGLRYSYYEGTWSTLPDFSRISSLKEGTLTDFSIAPRNRDENFGFVFEGFIKIDVAGSYTFYTTSDDGSKLYINGSEVVNNDGLHSARERSGSTNLTSGYHSIRVEFFERSGREVLQVRYSGPGVGKQIIPGSNLFLKQGEDQPPTSPDSPGDLISGLRYSYYEGTWSTLPDFSRISSLKEGTLTDFSIAPRNRDENFGFVFEGFIKIDAAGSYTFYTTSDDGSKLYINGSEVVNNDGLHSARERSGSTNLTSGYHSIRVEFFERSGREVLQVRYSGPGIGKQIIPATMIFLNSPNSNSRVGTESSLKGKTTSLGETQFDQKLDQEVLDNNEIGSIQVYPNPFIDKVYINFSINNKTENNYQAVLTDVSGKTIYNNDIQLNRQKQKLDIDMTDLQNNKGIYILKLYQNGQLLRSIKLIKN